MLAVSHQFLIKLLERGDIAHHMVGTHQRIYVPDLLDYKAKRHSNRRKSLDEPTRAESDDGIYYLEPSANRTE
jgi:excisionase family DNA binding protein